MSLIEFIGFIISMVALTFLFFKRLFEQRRRRLHPEKFDRDEAEQRENLKEFLRSLDIDMEDDKQFSPPPPPQIIPPSLPLTNQKRVRKKEQRKESDSFQFKRNLEHYREASAIEKRKLKTSIENPYYESFDERLLSKNFRTSSTSAYDVIAFEKTPRIQKMVTRLPSLKEIIVLKEIISPPKALRDPHEFS